MPKVKNLRIKIESRIYIM